jgi:ABC-type multidrug transport system ATPase subunit
VNETLVLDHISKRRSEEIFAPVSFTLHPGQGVGIFGYNGSGKTTLLDIIAGIEQPSGGSVARHGRIGYVMQHSGFQESLSFKDNLLLEAHLSGLSGEEAKRQAHLLAARLEILPYWTKRYSKGSSGMKSRLSVAAALFGQPQIILLDEAFNFLDQHSIEQTRCVLQAEKERGASLVMVSHDREDFSGLCERVLCLPSAEILPIEVWRSRQPFGSAQQPTIPQQPFGSAQRPLGTQQPASLQQPANPQQPQVWTARL